MELLSDNFQLFSKFDLCAGDTEVFRSSCSSNELVEMYHNMHNCGATVLPNPVTTVYTYTTYSFCNVASVQT